MFELLADDEKTYKIFQKLENLDLCAVLGNGKVFRNPLINTLITMARNYGRIPLSCPIKKGQYFLKNFKLDTKYSPPIVLFENFRVTIRLQNVPNRESIFLGLLRWYFVNKPLSLIN
jgi:Protein of unknown function (DUF1091)